MTTMQAQVEVLDELAALRAERDQLRQVAAAARGVWEAREIGGGVIAIPIRPLIRLRNALRDLKAADSAAASKGE